MRCNLLKTRKPGYCVDYHLKRSALVPNGSSKSKRMGIIKLQSIKLVLLLKAILKLLELTSTKHLRLLSGSSQYASYLQSQHSMVYTSSTSTPRQPSSMATAI